MRNRFRKGLSLLLAAVLSLAVFFACPEAAIADASGDISGTTKDEVTFNVYAGNGGGYFVLFASKGTAYVSNIDSSGRFLGYISEDDFGFFRVLVTMPGYEQTYLWAPSATLNTYTVERGQSLVVSLPYTGNYTVAVTPLSRQEINGSYWPQNRFHYWLTDASWIVSRTSNCEISAESSDQPSAGGSVTVYCYDIAKNYIQTYTESVTSSKTIYPQTIAGYKAASSTGQYIAVNNGVCNPNSVFFYYMKVAAYGSLTVYCFDSNGQLLQQYTETITESKTIYPQAISGYTAASSGQYITFGGGVCSPAAVSFTYQKSQPVAASLTVNCYDENGNYLNTYTEELTESKTVYPKAVSGYDVASPGQYIIYSSGTCTPSSISFYYRKIRIYPATLTVNCYDENGGYLRSYTEQITESKTVYPQAISGYDVASSGQYITYSSEGTCSPSSVSFQYKKKLVPATLTIRCIDSNGNVIRTSTESITASKTINPPVIAGYTVLSGSQQVSYSNGACTPNQIDFQYEIGSKVTPGSNPSMAYPSSWDTQFKPGTATHQNGTNARNFDKLWTMYDDSAGSSFFWVIYQVETVDNIPEFTAYFNEPTSISRIGIRNGNLLNSNTYTKYARVKRFEVWLYDKDGNAYKAELNIPDYYSLDYMDFPLGATYIDITRVEFWITGTADFYYGRDEGTNVAHLADIAFYQ